MKAAEVKESRVMLTSHGQRATSEATGAWELTGHKVTAGTLVENNFRMKTVVGVEA